MKPHATSYYQTYANDRVASTADQVFFIKLQAKHGLGVAMKGPNAFSGLSIPHFDGVIPGSSDQAITIELQTVYTLVMTDENTFHG